MSCADDVVRYLKEFFVGVVVEVERVDGVFAYGVDVEGAICSYRKGAVVLICL
jgi:hypothetical protein